jgi:hypothetical protein
MQKGGRAKVDLSAMQRHHFGDTSTTIVQGEQHGVITPTLPTSPIRRGEQGVHFGPSQRLNDDPFGAFIGNR